MDLSVAQRIFSVGHGARRLLVTARGDGPSSAARQEPPARPGVDRPNPPPAALREGSPRRSTTGGPPGDVLALVALGEALEAAGDPRGAARAYGAILDLFPARADLRRFAGGHLERLADGAGLDLAIDTYEKAREQRPDHPTSHSLLAFARLKRGEHAAAFDALAAGRAARAA